MNRDTLIVGVPYIQTNGNIRLQCEVQKPGENTEPYLIWFETEKKYGEYFCTDRCDGIVVNLLLYAMEHGYDIKCETPMSEKLWYQLTEYFIPSVSRNIAIYKRINIIAEKTDEAYESAHAVGASLSGGVDSFYTLFRHLDRKEKSYNITHFTYFNAGHAGTNGGEKAREKYKKRIGWIEDVASKMNLPFITVDTNINEFLQQEHQPTHTLRTLAIPLLLQKLFSKYYFSSGFEYEIFKFSASDTARYDLLTVNCLSTESLDFYLSGAEVRRIDKLRFISDKEITHSRLNVCVKEATNCSKCDKCMRTMMELFAIGKLDSYRDVFDIDYFNKHKHRYYVKMLAFRNWYARDDYKIWKDAYEALGKKASIVDRLAGRFYQIYRRLRKAVYKIPMARNVYEKYKLNRSNECVR